MKESEKAFIRSGNSKPEIGFVIVAVGLSTIAIASGYSSPYLLIKIISLVIFLLSIWAASIFYRNIIHDKINDGLKASGLESENAARQSTLAGAFRLWIKTLVDTALFTKKRSREVVLICAYLTILVSLFLYWLAGMFLYLFGILNFLKD